MKYLLYCIIGYVDKEYAAKRKDGHIYWFNPRMISTVRSYDLEKLVKIQMANGFESFWCDLGEWESIIDEIHANFLRPKDVRIQEVVVTK